MCVPGLSRPDHGVELDEELAHAGHQGDLGWFTRFAVNLRAACHTDRVFLDKASGKDVNRPQLELMLSFVREGEPSCAIRWTDSAATWTICGKWFSA